MKDNSTRRADILSYAAVGIFAIMLLVILIKGVPEKGSTTTGMAIQAVISVLLMVYGYQFGSSKSSQAKDEIIASQLPPQVPPADNTDQATK